jgi:hypothetical protein
MNKSSNSSSLNNIHFDEDWTSHPAIEWLSNHKNILIWVFAGLIIALIFATRLITWRTLDAEKDFFQAQTAFTQFEQTAGNATDGTATAADLEQLQVIMQRHPELKPKYEGSLAQTLLITGQVPQAQAYIEDIFKRTEPDHLQLYQNYTQTSVLIGQERYADALQNAKQLKSDLDQIGAGANPILYVYNLIRLAMLHQQMGQSEEELKAWEELQNQTQRLEAALEASQAFQVGNASLNQYMEERKSALTR